MKFTRKLLVILLLIINTAAISLFIILTTSFDRDNYNETNYDAVLMSREELEKSVAYQPPRSISMIGKIYKKDNWILITEKYKGIHLIDNTNPSAPVNTGFIRVPGCVDIAVKNTSVYADNSVDLVTIDISNLPQIRVTNRTRNIFPEPLPPDLQYMPSKFIPQNRPGNTFIVEWEKRQ